MNTTKLSNWKHLKGNSRQRRVARRKLLAALPPTAWMEQAGTRNIEAELAAAPDSETIHRLLSCGNSAKPTGTTRRRWLRAANLRYQQLRNAGEASEIPYLNPSVSSANAEKTGEKGDSAAGDEGV